MRVDWWSVLLWRVHACTFPTTWVDVCIQFWQFVQSFVDGPSVNLQNYFDAWRMRLHLNSQSTNRARQLVVCEADSATIFFYISIMYFKLLLGPEVYILSSKYLDSKVFQFCWSSHSHSCVSYVLACLFLVYFVEEEDSSSKVLCIELSMVVFSSSNCYLFPPLVEWHNGLKF